MLSVVFFGNWSVVQTVIATALKASHADRKSAKCLKTKCSLVDLVKRRDGCCVPFVPAPAEGRGVDGELTLCCARCGTVPAVGPCPLAGRYEPRSKRASNRKWISC